MPRLRLLLLCIAALLAIGVGAFAQNSAADVLEAPGTDLSDPAQRASAAAAIRGVFDVRRQAAKNRGLQLGIPLRVVHANGRVVELVDFIGNRPLYLTTHNANAAISTGANLLRATPYSVDGTGLTVGEWDGGSARSTHQEFGGRITVKDGAAAADHSTHVAGTIAAAGVIADVKGMAPSIRVDSYEWTSDKSEMTSRGASYPGESGKIYLSNHSYGYVSGWNYTGLASPRWSWYGSGTTSTGVEPDFGKYETNARDTDSLAFSLPYYLVLRSAGNDRLDNPATGDPVSLSTSTTSAVAYDPALHPAGDGIYRGSGYDTISYDATAKNALTIGSVGDAVSGSTRSLAGAYMSSYSSWGPTDDGRIKPDLVANGETLHSSFAGSDSAYGYMSGTSMATPNATGSAALVVNWWDKLFPGHVLRASTLKGLLIHTADDLGNPGPDYQFGWGLINVKAAADLMQAYKNNSGTRRIIEDQLTTATTTRSYSFTWDGSSPIRATLSWTDPAGTATTTSDLRTARLVNNLDLKITGPTGTVHQPWVMPFVGDWTAAKLSAAATTGTNNTDNVERVDIASPPVAGVYTATVTFSGTLTNGAQNYSLVLSGGVANATAPAPTSSAVTPNIGTTDVMILNLTGTGFQLGANVKLTKSGEPDVVATGQEIRPDNAKIRVNVNGMAGGQWNVVLTNPDGQSTTLPNSFSISAALWQDDLESGATGWTHSASSGYSTTNWALVTTSSRSATHAFYAAGPSAKNIDDLYSPAISIPSGSSNLRLTFWHNYAFQSGKDGGVLEFSINNGAWFDVTSTGSGASFATGGYTSTLSSSGNPNNRNPLAGQRAWSGSNTGFTQVAVDLTDAAKYAGNTLRIRWRLATDASTASTGWFIDDLSIIGAGGAVNLPPSVVTEASATPSPVTAQTTQLSVVGDDDAGESGLTYTWSAIGGSFERPVSFSDNGTNTAKTTAATFTVAGAYTFNVTVRDAQGLSATSSVDVVVSQTATGVSVSPASAVVVYGGTQSFTASVADQFGDPLVVQPAVSWSTSGGGTINASGLFIASTVGGPYTITATSGALAGTASVSVSKATATVSLSGLTRTYNGSAQGATVTTSPTGLATAVTYNGSSAVPTGAGSYAVVATITDANYQGTASGTLTINKATATVTLSNLTQTYDGNPKAVTVTTAPSGLKTAVTYGGSLTAPSDFGSYAVVATIDEANYQGTASGTMTIAGQTLSSWEAQHFTAAQISSGASALTADADGDGISNLAEYALGSDPNVRNAMPLPVRDASGFSLTFTRPKALPDVIYAAEASDDLVTWYPLTLELVADGPVQTMRVRDDLSTGTPSRRFIRLKFTK